MPELLLELLSEEIPARMQTRAAEDLKRLVCDGLKAAGLSFTKADAFATPRRLALVVDGIPAKQPDTTEEGKGPRADAIESAINGFLGKFGLDAAKRIEAISELEKKVVGQWWRTDVMHAPGQVERVGVRKRTLKKGLYLVYEIHRKGRNTAEILPDIICDAVRKLPWQKSMRWADKPFRWIRPLYNVVAIFNRRALHGGVYGLPFRMTTLGHSFIALRPLTIRSFSDYKNRLFKAKVILDPAERRQKIQAEADKLAKKAGLKLKRDLGLLDEITGLVEWPVVRLGSIDNAFMELPPELLTTVMRHHQKYFALTDGKGRLAPRFVVVLNTETRDGAKAAVAGNERVLRARLADARFFWDQDRKRTLESRTGDLGGRVFHARLGSLRHKVTRLEQLAGAIATACKADSSLAKRSARLAKADLSSGMVGEFPELQGVIGRYYALHDGEKPAVADALAEHYSPQGPNDDCPSKPVSVAVALADKIDTLVGLWSIGEKPTGSGDPFALRRAALGIIRIITENSIRILLSQYIRVAGDAYETWIEPAVPGATGNVGKIPLSIVEQIIPELLAFIAERLKVYLRDKGLRHDLIDAVFAVEKPDGGKEDDLVRLLARVDALDGFLKSDDGLNLLTAYRRAANIVRIEENKSGTRFDGLVNQSLFRQREESFLYASLLAGGDQMQKALDSESYLAAMEFFANLRSPIDAFFDRVTVNASEPALRENRLKLLAQITATMNRVADFSKLEGGER